MMIENVSCSPDRHSFSSRRYIQKLLENPDDDTARGMVEYYEQVMHHELTKILDPEWKINNMEYDLRSTEWILLKVKDDTYAQNLYAALCNNSFRSTEVIELLKGSEWSCSWRHAGGIIADMRGEGDYIDWYCSGIREQDEDAKPTPGVRDYVSESVVTDEIREDLLKLGWLVLPQEDE